MLKKTQEETKKIKETIKPNYHKATCPPLTDANLKPRSPTLNHKVHLKLPQNTEKEKQSTQANHSHQNTKRFTQS
jgi:hypothetical protein